MIFMDIIFLCRIMLVVVSLSLFPGKKKNKHLYANLLWNRLASRKLGDSYLNEVLLFSAKFSEFI